MSSSQNGKNVAVPMNDMSSGAMPISVQPGAYIVPPPNSMPGVPVGLEYLSALNKIVIQQKIEIWELLTDYETKNKYMLKNANGEQAYYAYEESGCCSRNCCANQRGFKIHIIDNFKREVLTVDRPFKCCGDACCGLCAGSDSCAQECDIYTPQGPLAHIRQLPHGCSPKYELRATNDEFSMIISGPCCCEFMGCHDHEFQVSMPDGSHVGEITKKWRGCCTEAYTDADTFAVTFPYDLSVKAKAALVGATFLIKPRSIGRWNGVKEATKFGPSCYPHGREVIQLYKTYPQFDFTYSEDCLTLNIIRPAHSNGEDLPVLVWIHGGAYELGSASLYGYKDFANIYVSQDIIVVTIQYRLGFLGFLTTGDKDAPGNMGLFDQAEAMKWLYDNIGSFGGDKTRIRVWGLSAGEYINGSFEMSGAAWNDWAIGYDNSLVHNTKNLGVALGCVRDIRNCLKKKSIDEIYDAMTQKVGIRGSDIFNLRFGPRIDGDFFPDHPSILAKTAKRRPPSVIGIGAKESAYFIIHGLGKVIQEAFVNKEDWPNFNKQKFREAIDRQIIVKSEFRDTAEYALNEIVEFYSKGAKNDDDYLHFLNQYTSLWSDINFSVGAANAIMSKANNNWPVYAYSFEHYNEKNFEALPEKLRGSTHTNEYPYMFNMFILGRYDIEKDPEEINMKNIFRNSLVSFVKNGIPKTGYIDWPVVYPTEDPKDIQYLKYLPKPEIGKGYYHEAHEFWTNLKKNVEFDLIEFRKSSVQRDEL